MGKILILVCTLAFLVVGKAQELSTSNPNAPSAAKIENRNETRTTRRPQWQGAPTRRNFGVVQNQPIADNYQESDHSEMNPQQPQRSANIQAPGIDSRSRSIANQPGSPTTYRNPINPDVTGEQPSNRPVGRNSYQPRSLDSGNVGYRQRFAQEQPRIPAPRDQSGVSYIPDDVSYKPYSFNYVSDAEDGHTSHQQSADDSGRVIGSYSFILDDGRRRVVEYIADQNGFRANIDSNEPGMSVAENPADVSYYSNNNAGRSGVSGPSVSDQRGTSSYSSFSNDGARNYFSSSDAPGFTSYRTQGTDSEFRSDRGIQDDYRVPRVQSPEERNFARPQSSRAADSIPRTIGNVPSSDGRRSFAPAVVGNAPSSDGRRSFAPDAVGNEPSSDGRRSFAPDAVGNFPSSDGRRSFGPDAFGNVPSSDGRRSFAPDAVGNIPSSDGRRSFAPAAVGNEETPDINALARPYQPALPESRRFDGAPGARAYQATPENVPRDESPRYLRRPQESGITSNSIPSGGQPGLRTPSIRSYFHLGDAATSGVANSEDTPIELGPAMASFFGSRTQSTASRRASSEEVHGRGRDANIPSGPRSHSQVVPKQDANQNNNEQAANRRVASDSANNVGLNYQPLDSYAGRQQGSSLTPNIPTSDQQNTPLVEYHALHSDGTPQYFYSVDNGQYWFHRH